MTVKRFDVRGSAQTVLFRGGSFFGDEKQAERVIRERSGRLAAFEKTKPILERDSWQSCGRPFEVLFGMSIMSLLCLNAVLSQSF